MDFKTEKMLMTVRGIQEHVTLLQSPASPDCPSHYLHPHGPLPCLPRFNPGSHSNSWFQDGRPAFYLLELPNNAVKSAMH
jgi:hypothetical protein